MRGSDIYDRYATGNTVPQVDSIQNVQLLGGFQNDTHTILRFSRPWSTCDEAEDLELSKDDTVRLIWAYGNSDPVGGDPMSIGYHSQRGGKSIFLSEPRFQMPLLGEDVKAWDVRSPNVTLPEDLTTIYWCKLFKIPPMPQKTHVIGYVPLISKDNIQHVHHILLYECHLPESDKYFERWIDVDGAQCFGANMPVSWRYCTSPLVAWAVGGEGNMVPENIGFPLGEEHGGATYFMMELHYDNPNLRKGVVDNSGLRVFYTENLRPVDAGILILGHKVSPMQIIPPRQHWFSTGICSSGCTAKQLPETGITIFAGILHSHLLGRNITLRHVRENKELPVVIRDLSYDFNFQEIRNLKKESTVLPGDILITECGLDSTSRTNATFGGFGTGEEMCLAFMFYYPRTELAYCASGPSTKSLFNALGIEEVYPPKGQKPGSTNEFGIDVDAETQLADGLRSGTAQNKMGKVDFVQLFRGIVVKSPAKYENRSLYDIVTSKGTWDDNDMIQRMQEIVSRGEHKETCDLKSTSRGVKLNDEASISYPEFTALPPEVNRNCFVDGGIGNGNGNGNGKENGNGNGIGNWNGNGNEIGSETGGDTEYGVWKPLPCLPQLPSCSLYRWQDRVLANRPTFF
ncbi:MOXD1 homolog 1-like [Macrobrachium rosenbergii]|uniref:MOXD1 homolog 1-like n=1 Tax=Macrobrachium rosenbergii TaxID=79674 RepID=UPI0034D3E659